MDKEQSLHWVQSRCSKRHTKREKEQSCCCLNIESAHSTEDAPASVQHLQRARSLLENGHCFIWFADLRCAYPCSCWWNPFDSLSFCSFSNRFDGHHWFFGCDCASCAGRNGYAAISTDLSPGWCQPSVQSDWSHQKSKAHSQFQWVPH